MPTTSAGSKTRSDALTPRGSTNLAGGMQRGIDEARDAKSNLHLSDTTLSRVVVLTDGLANTGVTNAGEIASLAVDARRQGVRVSTIGLGLDYNEDLLQSIAEGGGGKYYYVESPVQLARIFEEELKSAFATCARDVHISFHGNGAVRGAELGRLLERLGARRVRRLAGFLCRRDPQRPAAPRRRGGPRGPARSRPVRRRLARCAQRRQRHARPAGPRQCRRRHRAIRPLAEQGASRWKPRSPRASAGWPRT